MKKIIKHLKEHKVPYFILCISLLAFLAIFIANRYAQDTYYLEAFGYKNNAINPYIKDGRLFMTLFLSILGFLKIPFSIGKFCSWLLAFFSILCSMFLFYQMVRKINKNKWTCGFLSFGAILSPFVLEFFMFPEYTGVCCFGILLCTLTSFFLVNYFESHQKKYLFASALASFFAAFTYQGILSLLVIFPLLFLFYYSKSQKDIFLNHVWIAICYGISCFTTLLFTKLFGSTRTLSSFDLSNSFLKIKEGVIDLLTTTGRIFPNYLFIICFIVLVLIAIVFILKQKKQFRKFFLLIYFSVATLLVTIMPHFMTNSDYIWMVPRSNIGLGLFVLVALFYLLIYLKPKIIYQSVALAMFVFFLFFQFYGFIHYGINQIKNNAMDQVYMNQVKHEINQYEKNVTWIEEIIIYQDQEITYVNPSVFAKDNMNVRAFAALWSAESFLKITTHKKVKVGTDINDFSKMCQGENWEAFDLNQFHFDSNRLYLCIY